MKQENRKRGKKEKKEIQKTNIALLAVLLAILIIVLIFSYKQILLGPPTPPPSIHQFYGNVVFANTTAMPNSAVIYALVNGEIKASSNVANGRYGYTPLFNIENASLGDVVNFYINYSGNNINVANYNFALFELTELNLVFSYCGDKVCYSGESCSSCAVDCGSCSNPNPPGPSGGGPGSTASCSDTCITKKYDCGTWTICGAIKNCGACTIGVCNSSGKCVAECDSGQTKVCGSYVGECKQGSQTCANGAWGQCLGSINPVTEACDGKDNNCNLLVDENCQKETPGKNQLIFIIILSGVIAVVSVLILLLVRYKRRHIIPSYP